MIKAQHTTKNIGHMAESANFEVNTFNKNYNGLIRRRLEMPHAPYFNVVGKAASHRVIKIPPHNYTHSQKPTSHRAKTFFAKECNYSLVSCLQNFNIPSTCFFCHRAIKNQFDSVLLAVIVNK
jgi:hypothetical protein